MAKLKEVRALKSSGVEPLAPTLIKRILHNLVLKAEDRRWASEIGPLSMLGELTARQTSAAYHVGEIYGRFEWLHGRRRSAASPSYAGTGIAMSPPVTGLYGKPVTRRTRRDGVWRDRRVNGITRRPGDRATEPRNARSPSSVLSAGSASVLRIRAKLLFEDSDRKPSYRPSTRSPKKPQKTTQFSCEKPTPATTSMRKST
jgi:hypothetical protein